MDSFTNNNVNFNGNKPSLHKSRSNASFSQAAVAKSDVGDFQEGYFVMAEMPPLPQQRTKIHKTPERNQRKNEHSNNRHQQSRERSTKEIEQLLQRDGEPNFSTGRTTTSPNRSPTRNKRTTNSHSPQRHQTSTYTDSTTAPSSPPHRPHKAHSQPHIHYEKRVERSESSPSFSFPESGSPPKGPSPSTPNRWAGPAFSNAPPPSSLPIPDFPPFNPATAPSAANPTSLSTSPPTSAPLPGPTFVPQQSLTMYHETLPPQYITSLPQQPPVYTPVAYHGYPLHLAYEIPTSPPSLAQLSTDLRKMLNIGGQPIPA
eukprot:Phypoly_transcript_08183.p1 GENE.Phypoly_transcript_08183~~Phypoly_transcript_08183.p1  ORF type:complete len:315 (+),score=64.23 Phypoly_transcript_08183:173-1117(+)